MDLSGVSPLILFNFALKLESNIISSLKVKLNGIEYNRLPKHLLNYHPKGRRRPGRPLKRLLDDMTAETETGHSGLNS
jgi:hypothetical protein